MGPVALIPLYRNVPYCDTIAQMIYTHPLKSQPTQYPLSQRFTHPKIHPPKDPPTQSPSQQLNIDIPEPPLLKYPPSWQGPSGGLTNAGFHQNNIDG